MTRVWLGHNLGTTWGWLVDDLGKTWGWLEELNKEMHCKNLEQLRIVKLKWLGFIEFFFAGGLSPEELSSEPSNIIDPMFDSLLELATQESNDCDEIRSLASACLLSLSIGYGDTGKTLLASSSMLMSQPHGPDNIKMPPILGMLLCPAQSILWFGSILGQFHVNFRSILS